MYRSGFETCPTDNTPLAPLVGDPLIGTTIADQYLIDSCVGEGMMGRVYLAHHTRLKKRRFALKVLLGDVAADPTMRLRFEQEAEAASRLQHPNVVSVLDYGATDTGLHYLVMDFVEGGSLSNRVEQGALPEAEAIELTKGICRGLAHAHDQGLIHRDFKPDNVALVEHDGRVVPKILDFGLALINTPEESSVRLTSAGLVVGTPAYVSPEQSQGHAVDRRTDLFALGVSLYEMLSGKLPFDGSVIDVLYKNATTSAPPILERAGIEVSTDLEDIISKLMARNVAERYQSANEVLADLEKIQKPANRVVFAALGTSLPSRRVRSEMESAQTQASADSGSSDLQDHAAESLLASNRARNDKRKRVAIAVVLGVAAAASFFLVFGGKDESKRELLAGPAQVSDAGTFAGPADAQVEVAIENSPDSGAAEAAPPTFDAGTSDVVAVVPKPPKAAKIRKPKATKNSSPEPEPEPEPIPEPKPTVPVKPTPVETPKPTAPKVFKARGTFAAFDSHGSLSDSKVMQSLRPALPRFEACYELAARAAKRNARITVKVRYTISENGRMTKIEVGTTSLPRLSDCISKNVKKLRSRDRPDTGPQRVEFTLHYEPKQ